MKKVFVFMAMILCAMGVFAKKQVVYVEYFSYAEGIGEARSEQVRTAVISSLASYQHLQVVDVASQQSLAVEKNRRSDEDALEDETARIGKMKKLGANYLIQGYIPILDVDEKKEYDKETGEVEKTEYNATMTYSIKVIDCENGVLISTDLFNVESGPCKKSEEAVNKVMKKIPMDVATIVTKNFKMTYVILDADYESKKNKLLKCYINLGEDDGVTPGTVFAVKKATIKVGRVSWIEIGELVVENIVASDLAYCKVRKGFAEIYAALEEVISIKESDPNNAHDLIVESKSFK